MPQSISPSSAPPAVAIRDARRVFPNGVAAIEHITLDVPAGQFLAILGPSGCGKSTLLRAIAGLDQLSSGTIHITAPSDLAYVFQDPHLLPWRTVLDNAALPLELRGMSRQDRRDRAAAILDHVGLGDAMHRYPAQLSGGMRMRVSLARALVTQPRLLLMDEPFAALDAITRQRLDEMLRRIWRERDMTVIFVTHAIGEATYLAERAVVLSRRPARVLLDTPIDLPADRPDTLRADPAFAEQTRALHAALANEVE